MKNHIKIKFKGWLVAVALLLGVVGFAAPPVNAATYLPSPAPAWCGASVWGYVGQGDRVCLDLSSSIGPMLYLIVPQFYGGGVVNYDYIAAQTKMIVGPYVAPVSWEDTVGAPAGDIRARTQYGSTGATYTAAPYMFTVNGRQVSPFDGLVRWSPLTICSAGCTGGYSASFNTSDPAYPAGSRWAYDGNYGVTHVMDLFNNYLASGSTVFVTAT